MADESFLSQVKRLLVGAPIPSHLAHHERFSRVTGLAVLSSDPLSSVAYATEEILRVLTIGGVAALSLVTPIGVVIATMLAIVVFSYRQTIHAYPNGGGAYIVAKENLGRAAEPRGRGRAAHRLRAHRGRQHRRRRRGDHVGLSRRWHLNRVEISLVFVAILMLGNLRGVRESGRLFAAPTYFFIVSILVMLAVGRWRYLTGGLARRRPSIRRVLPAGHVDALDDVRAPDGVLERLHGDDRRRGRVERRAGVPAAGEQERRVDARDHGRAGDQRCSWASRCSPTPTASCPIDTETVVSQIAAATFGGRGLLYYAVQAATMLILVLAANTAYADFPAAGVDRRARPVPAAPVHEPGRSAGVLERHRHPERAGRRCCWWLFGGDTHALIPLYMIGVFVSFTLSQAGMVLHWRTLRDAGLAHAARSINGFGAIVTGDRAASSWRSRRRRKARGSSS